MPTLALRDVALADGSGWLFENVDLALAPRARACLVGRNATGKSTLLRMLADAVAPDFGDRTASAGLRIALAAQEPIVAGPTLVEFAMACGTARHAAEEALAAFGLNPARGAGALSGGETRRAALATAFAADPDVLLLDEPTNHLDVLAIQALEERLARSRAAVLIVSHDRAFLTRVTTSCFWLENRRVRRLNGGFARFEAWAEEIATAEAQQSRRLDVAIDRGERWLSRGVTARRARNEGRRRRLLGLRAEKAQQLRLARGEVRVGVVGAALSGRLVIEAEGVAKTVGGRTLLAGLSVRIMRGERVAIVGANGSGKTTLVKVLIGEVAPDCGVVRLGSNLSIAYVDQRRADLAAGLTVLRALAPAGGDQVMVQGAPRHVSAYAKQFLFRDEQLRQNVESLSGGERNRLLLARVLARPSNLLVLDEPTNDLDMESLDVLEDVLAGYAGTLMLVSHDRDFIDRVATSTIALDGRGRFVETPGGWSDFVAQNPLFLSSEAEVPRRRSILEKQARHNVPSLKLTYKDERRLAELETNILALSAAIMASEAILADPDLYRTDPISFGRRTVALAKAKTELAAAESEWLVLEGRRELLTKQPT